MSASAGLAANASVQAAAAAAEARAAKVTACMKYVQGFKNDGATVAEMREYAGCVDLLHPAQMSGPDVWMAKAAIVVVLLGMVAGLISGWRAGRSWDSWWERFIMSPLVGGVIAALAIGVVGLVVAGFMFLVQA